MEEMKKGNVDGYLSYQDDQAIEIFASQMSNIGSPNIRQRLGLLAKNGSFTKLETTIKSVQGLGPIALASGRIEWTYKNNTSNTTTDLNRYVVWMLLRQPDGSWKTLGWINDRPNQVESADDITAVRKVLTTWNNSIKVGQVLEGGNVDAMAAIYSSQGIEIFGDGRSNVGLGNLKTRWNGFIGSKFDANSLGTVGVEVTGRKAIAWGAAVQGYYPKDAAVVDNFDFPWIMVLTKEADDQWRILVFHWRPN
jgi:ketosteroid isomerase-like protein